MDKKPVLDIKIESNGPAVHMTGENGEVDMIPFKGSVDSEIFRGIVEPCGVETQVVNAAHVRHMSARYMLTGVDADGNACHIYVENNGWFDDLTKSMPFHTPCRPSIPIARSWRRTCTATSSLARAWTRRMDFTATFTRSTIHEKRIIRTRSAFGVGASSAMPAGCPSSSTRCSGAITRPWIYEPTMKGWIESFSRKSSEWQGESMKDAVLYIHGKGGCAAECEHYRSLFPNCEVTGLDYQNFTPWETGAEIRAEVEKLKAKHERITLIAVSIGAYFSMNAGIDTMIERAFFISPIVDMEKLIADMMQWANVTEAELKSKGIVRTAFGEDLSWDYLCYVRSHPIRWAAPTRILYGSRDNLTLIETVEGFAKKRNAGLTVMEGGEHWFHTEEQMRFLDAWIRQEG